MKRKMMATVATIMMFGNINTVFAASDVQLRDTLERLSYDVQWNAEDKSVTIQKGNFSNTIYVDKNEYNINGEKKALEHAPTIINDKVHVPYSYFKNVLPDFDANAKLAMTNWQGTVVNTENGTDVTELNKGFIGLAKYSNKDNRYEFFDKATGQTRDDSGVYFVTQDGKHRVLISQTKNYQALVDMIQLDNEMFEYKRNGKLDDKTEGSVFVEHVPYQGKLEFTNPMSPLKEKTGDIETKTEGRDILGKTLWQGTVVLDEKGNDVSAYNQNFLGLAKYDASNNKYEFFDKQTGETRGDFGYFDVINNNKERVTFSVGKKYAAVLELTELNDQKFTYVRKGKDANGNEIKVYVEHVPYDGKLNLKFTF